ncbi:TolC family protein [Tahibacter amnicola]|uniref:TolC family protein n=1 Tax=Tahibacter amnicola TaxID=2976241 RepID=A0ABY6B8V7_9GAMM|nr:TolC family protein [Tahibacter amnicola]UXI66454.1 TolC family protein [Tahibacter amnicola]
MKRLLARTPAAFASLFLCGCVATAPRDDAAVERWLSERLPATFQWAATPDARGAIDARVAELTRTPLTPTTAFSVAQLASPEITHHYAQLGIAWADVIESSRLENPGLSLSTQKGGGIRRVTTGITAAIGDLLLLPSRRQWAQGEYERAQQTIASALLNLAADIEDAWYSAAAAEQVAQLREAVAKAAGLGAELASRHRQAGTFSALESSLAQAEAASARIAATTARAEATRRRFTLNAKLGLTGTAAHQWKFALPLGLPVAAEDPPDALLALATDSRLDLAAARREVALLADALRLAKRWRLLGSVEIGVEQERETGSARMTGPTLSLALPLFHQGQAAIARADAQLLLAQAGLATLERQIDNDVRQGIEQVAAIRGIVEEYRKTLLPEREAIVQRQGERQNYMLVSTFELLLAKQQEFDAYQGYIESVRDYWQARTALARAVGTQLPSAAEAAAPMIDIDTIVTPPQPEGGHHHGHGSTPAATPKHEDAVKKSAQPEQSPEHHHHHDHAPAPETTP